MGLPFNKLKTPLNTIPFDKLEPKDYLVAAEKGLKIARKRIAKIAKNRSCPNFKNTIEDIEFASKELERVYSAFFAICSLVSSKTNYKYFSRVESLVNRFNYEIYQNKVLYKKVLTVFKSEEVGVLNKEQRTLLNQTHQAFLDGGISLNKKDRAKYKNLIQKIAHLENVFDENIAKSDSEFSLYLKNESKLKGVPESVIDILKENAEREGYIDGVLILFNTPIMDTIIRSATNRSIRKAVYIAKESGAFKNKKNSNIKVAEQIILGRNSLAKLLGYNSFSDYILRDHLALNPNNAISFLEKLTKEIAPKAKKEFEELSAFALKVDGVTNLQRWDFEYYKERLRKKQFKLNHQEISEYFETERTVRDILDFCSNFFQIQFEERRDVSRYHESVKVFEVADLEGNHLAVLYLDLYNRETKDGMDWMLEMSSQYRLNNEIMRPHLVISTNFTPPRHDIPSLLDPSEVENFLHEMGHALHAIFSNVTYGSLSGTNVVNDFVEFPSQFMEKWLYEEDVISKIAKHYITGSNLPKTYLKNLKKSKDFMSGITALRQIHLGLIDLTLHSIEGHRSINLKKIENRIQRQIGDCFPVIPDTCITTTFRHIFGINYHSRYYSYKWSEVISDKCFNLFLSNKNSSRELAELLKTSILSRGGSIDPNDMINEFFRAAELLEQKSP